jgi:hypothetical protein
MEGGGPTPSVAASVSTDPGSAASGTADICKVFTTDEIGSAVGQPVHLGDSSLLFGAGCRYDTADGTGELIIQALLPGQYNDLVGGSDQHTVSGIGEKAFFGPSVIGGVLAGAVANNTFYTVQVNPAPPEAKVLDLLRTFISRHP